MSPSIELRIDPELALKIMHENSHWQTAHGLEPTMDWLPEKLTMERFERVYDAIMEEFLVLFIDGKPAGSVIFQHGDKVEMWEDMPEKDAMYIYKFCVSDKFHGWGVSKIFLDALKKYAQDRGIKTVRLDTAARKPALHKMYENNGFVLKGETQGSRELWLLYEWESDL